MPFVHEIQVISSGYPGAPGYTNLYFETTILEDRTFQWAAARDFLEGMRNIFPSTWSGVLRAEGRVLEATSGTLALLTSVPAASMAPAVGARAGGYGSGVSGLVVGWGTATINRGRLVRGRSFMVPIAAEVYEGDGTLLPLYKGIFQGAADNLIASNTGFGVWSRPRLGVGGLLAPAVSANIRDRAAYLSSRRGL